MCWFVYCSVEDALQNTEAAARGVLCKKVILEISQNSQEITCARVSFFKKLQAWGLQLYQKRDSGTGAFFWILWNFYEHLFRRTPLDDCFWKWLFCALLKILENCLSRSVTFSKLVNWISTTLQNMNSFSICFQRLWVHLGTVLLWNTYLQNMYFVEHLSTATSPIGTFLF